MLMLVTPMRCRGIALTPDERRRYPPIRGDVGVTPTESEELNRSSNVATVRNGLPLEPDALPKLQDATLSGMAPTGFVLSGIEYVDGCAYAQSWWCRLA
ncbi:hypothetical protein CYL20_11640 [Pseudomonas palleroniana]|uniref:Uncharacterized protein n=1 Tax=Pseudomonas palleroniana TaxID=191390 RepID=A0A2L1J9L5_9PSED|nr:hypothetical protein [Pseudomonas palleroniana]AVE05165.1 hypothetical protein CYL20_11640 [Pseudomonas palleroniana]